MKWKRSRKARQEAEKAKNGGGLNREVSSEPKDSTDSISEPPTPESDDGAGAD